MKSLLLIVVLAFTLAISGWRQAASSAQPSAQSAPESVNAHAAIPIDQENARQARALLNQAIQALGGQTYLNLRDMQQTGRTFGFYHGRPSGTGAVFWRFVEYPDKERLELTKERDVAYLYIADKGYEVTFKGAHAVEKKDLDDYLRRRRFSLETMLKVWLNDPGVALFYDGTALAGNLASQQVTLDLAAGRWAIEFIDPVSGKSLGKRSYTAAGNGITLEIPEFQDSIAFRLNAADAPSRK